MKASSLFLAIMIAGALILSSCKKSDDSNPVAPTPPVTHATGGYVGTVAGASETGVLALTISTTSPKSSGRFALTIYTVSGSVTVGGSTILLTGRYNTANDSLYVSGGGYSFAGTYINGVLSGSYTGPHGSGGFSSQSASGADSVHVYLGTSTSQVSGHSGATLNIVTKGNALVGLAVGTSGNKTPFYGTISGNAIAISVKNNGVTISLATGAFSSSAHTAATGSYTAGDDHGTWSIAIAR